MRTLLQFLVLLANIVLKMVQGKEIENAKRRETDIRKKPVDEFLRTFNPGSPDDGLRGKTES